MKQILCSCYSLQMRKVFFFLPKSNGLNPRVTRYFHHLQDPQDPLPPLEAHQATRLASGYPGPTRLTRIRTRQERGVGGTTQVAWAGPEARTQSPPSQWTVTAKTPMSDLQKVSL